MERYALQRACQFTDDRRSLSSSRIGGRPLAGLAGQDLPPGCTRPHGQCLLEARALTGRGSAPADPELAADPPRDPAPAAPRAEPEVDHPAPQAGAARPTAGAVRRLALDRLSQSEVEVVDQLAEHGRRWTGASSSSTATPRCSRPPKPIWRHTWTAGAAARRDRGHDCGARRQGEAKLASLVKIYETMKPKAAAEIFNRLECRF
jgi:hypothetical protein